MAKKGQTYYYIVKAVNNKTYSAASPQKRIKKVDAYCVIIREKKNEI